MVNAFWEALAFTVQDGAAAEWRRIVDRGRESPDDFRERPRAAPLTSASYVVGPRSVVVLLRPKGR
jgi:hypothetical protein